MNKYECTRIALVKSASVKELGKQVYNKTKAHYNQSSGLSKLNVILLGGSGAAAGYAYLNENSKDKAKRDRAQKAKFLAIGLGGLGFIGSAVHEFHNPGVKSPVYETISKIMSGGD